MPNLPQNITQVYYIDPSLPTSGDGTEGNPFNTLNDTPEYSGGFLTTNNKAYLFKRGTRFPDSGTRDWFRVVGHGNYIGAYGEGEERAELHFSSGMAAIIWEGNNNIIKDIHLFQFNTSNNGMIFRNIDYPAYTNKSEGCIIENVIVTGGYRGITTTRVNNLTFKDVTIHGQMDDGVFGGDLVSSNPTQWVLFDNVHIYDTNRNYITDPTDSSGGDCIQMAALNVTIKDSILDHSKHGHKFAYINSATYAGTNTLIDNTLILLHPHSNHGTRGQDITIANSVIFGGRFQTDMWGNSHIYNSLLIGYGKDVSHTFHDGTYQTKLTGQGVKDFYNNVVVNMPFAIDTHGANVRNSIFYNVGIFLQGRRVAGSGNIHYNEDATTQEGIDKYLHNDGITTGNINAYIVADPLFIDPVTIFELRQETDHDWWELIQLGDFRLQSNSPAINNGDPNAYDEQATFIYGEDGSITRGFTDNILVETDKNGITRPQGVGYDTGAYEWFSEDPPYALNLNVIGNGTILKNPDLVDYNGETVELTAIPDSEYEFTGWGGALSGNANPESLVMNGNKTVSAIFSEIVVPDPDPDPEQPIELPNENITIPVTPNTVVSYLDEVEVKLNQLLENVNYIRQVSGLQLSDLVLENIEVGDRGYEVVLKHNNNVTGFQEDVNDIIVELSLTVDQMQAILLTSGVTQESFNQVISSNITNIQQAMIEIINSLNNEIQP